MSEFPQDELAERIARLERSNRRWRMMGLASSLAFAASLILAVSAVAQKQPAQKDAAPPPAAVQTATDAATLPIIYANYFKMTPTSEEVILDCGLNTQQGDNGTKLTSRLVVSYYTAKRLSAGLEATIQHYEKTYGTIETDANKRAR